MTRKIAVLAAVLAAALGAAPVRAQVPQVLTYSGYLKTSAGAPVTTVTNLTFRLYAAPSGGAALWTETVSTAPSPDGWFSVVLGGTSPLPLSALGNDAYLAIQFESEAEFTQRARLTPSHAAIAVDWTRVTNRPSACTAGQFLTGYDASGTALCATPPGGTAGVSSIVAGERISVSGTGAVTISLTGCPAAGQILRWEGTGWACVADSTGTLSAVQGLGVISASTTGSTVQLSLGGCGATANQILQWNGASWACIPTPTPVGGGVSSVGVTSPIVNNGSATAPVLALTNACASGQVLKWNGTTWACANDQDTTNPGTVTSVAPAATAGNPIAVANGTGAATIDLPPAGAGTSGYLRATDWSAFNAKLTPPTCAVGQIMKWDGSVWSCAADAVNAGTVTAVTAASPLVSSGGGAPQISLPAASSGQGGYLTSADWILFNSKITAPAVCTDGQVLKWNGVSNSFVCGPDNSNAGTVTGVTAAAPLASTGGATPQISMPAAGATSSGYLTAADWAAFSAKLTPPSGCAGGDGIVWDPVGVRFTCQTVVSLVSVTAPLGASSGGGIASISLSGCTQAGQQLMWNGTSWVCSDFGFPLQVLGRTSTAPSLFLPQATNSTDGFLTAGDWVRFDAKISGIAPGQGIQVNAVIDPLNPLVAVDFAGTGSASTAARSDHSHPIRVSVPLAELQAGTGTVVLSSVTLGSFATFRAWTVPAGPTQVAVNGSVVLPSGVPPALRVTIYNPTPTLNSYSIFVATSGLIAGQVAPDTRISHSSVTVPVGPQQTGVATVQLSLGSLQVANTACLPGTCPVAKAGDLLWFSIGSTVGGSAYHIVGVELVF